MTTGQRVFYENVSPDSPGPGIYTINRSIVKYSVPIDRNKQNRSESNINKIVGK